MRLVTFFADADGYWLTTNLRPCRNPQFDAHEVVARARSRLGENRYPVLSNNCEHVCEWCLHGNSRSLQVEHLRMRPQLVLLAALQAIARPLVALREAIWNLHAWSDSTPWLVRSLRHADTVRAPAAAHATPRFMQR